jgi:LAS superfamily LD-carboxypeptidase LdcB
VDSAPTKDLGRIGAADGFIPADETLSPFGVDQPAVGNLKPDLLSAIQRAAADAAIDGIDIRINSGWRSARYQQQLLNEAITTYGSEQEALKWVDTPEQSSHVAGKAIDIAPTAADDWLVQHGAAYGLCQTYANEIWHFELAVAPGMTCPAPKADASDG